MVTGAEVNEQFFKAPESTLDQAAAYPFMTPIFGPGVVFDASPEERQEALKNQALRGDQMRGHATTIENEINRMVADWGDEGEVDLLDFFAELTIYNTAACLVGLPFREEIDHRFAEAYHGLERGTDALAYVDPYMEGVESFEIRDRSRATLVSLVQDIIDRRRERGHGGPGRARPARRADLARHGRRLHHRRLHLDALRRPPHLVRHVGVDAHRADAPPRRDGRGRHRARRPLRRRLEAVEISFQALRVDPQARVGDQGDPAAAPAADHPDAPGRRGDRARRPHDPGRHDRGVLARGSRTGWSRTSRTPRPSTRPATRTAARPTSRTAGPGSRSAPASTAASATRSR